MSKQNIIKILALVVFGGLLDYNSVQASDSNPNPEVPPPPADIAEEMEEETEENLPLAHYPEITQVYHRNAHGELIKISIAKIKKQLRKSHSIIIPTMDGLDEFSPEPLVANKLLNSKSLKSFEALEV